jgi:hypothetical protein
MNRLTSLIFILCSLAHAEETGPPAAAQAPNPEAPAAAILDQAPPDLKTIELEWEPIENADGYEVRLTPEGGKPIFFRTFESKLSEEIPVGVYNLRIRSRSKEAEDLWSPWSDGLRLEVLKKELVLEAPLNESTIVAKSGAREEIEFKWTEIPKVRDYVLKIWTEETKEKPLVFVTRRNSQRLKLLPSQVYFWQVTFESATATQYVQVVKTNMFTLQGPKLVKPSITPFKPGEERTGLSWISSKRAQSYSAQLFFRYLDQNEWQEYKSEDPTETRWDFGKLKPGAYKLEVVAHAPRHADSDKGSYEFLIKPKQNEIEQSLLELAKLSDGQ